MRFINTRTLINGVITFIIVITEAFLHFNYVKRQEIRDLNNDDNDANDIDNTFRLFFPEGNKVLNLGVIALFISILSSVLSEILIRKLKLHIK